MSGGLCDADGQCESSQPHLDAAGDGQSEQYALGGRSGAPCDAVGRFEVRNTLLLLALTKTTLESVFHVVLLDGSKSGTHSCCCC